MTSFGAYVLSLALVVVAVVNAAAAKFSAATGRADDGYLFQGDPRARNVVEYGHHAGGDFDVLPNVDRVVEFYDPSCG